MFKHTYIPMGILGILLFPQAQNFPSFQKVSLHLDFYVKKKLKPASFIVDTATLFPSFDNLLLWAWLSTGWGKSGTRRCLGSTLWLDLTTAAGVSLFPWRLNYLASPS